MNYVEGLLAAALLLICILLTIYFGRLVIDILHMKYVFEATRHAACNSNSTGNLIVAMCVKLGFNGTITVSVYNVTINYPGS
ncbi:hypothetical protein [Pyrobaculum aerophilum]|uniref:Uncharacterized protein n=1 Tax=Pyrobaculum aerophilum TaxID=13773 RepID=A0A371R6S5_9CREN|nr:MULTISPECIES: hypothetical protein [Pyrobaculum]MCX8136483.1 hypothetical protein [Pyrobaculum aerophilum]RFA95675.1 hypothetical protein CGL51_07230 [Pyrobaculum aerophilum]RFB00210.1 hypothetical protein CGL52_01060 [Pyrobaculum aerophilum]HII46475.1 hypothetical protein [Pyrobaculum aerophilum]